LGREQTIHEEQVYAAQGILEGIRDAVNPEFIGIISTRGLPVTVLSPGHDVDADAIASLAASSFAATSQLSGITGDSRDRAVMFHEGGHTNIHISMVNDDFLLVIVFRRSSDIGKVRVIAGRAQAALAAALQLSEIGGIKKNNGPLVEKTKKAAEGTSPRRGSEDGSD